MEGCAYPTSFLNSGCQACTLVRPALASPSAFALALDSLLRPNHQPSHVQAPSRAWRATPPSARSSSPATPPRAPCSRPSGRRTVRLRPMRTPAPRPAAAPLYHACTRSHVRAHALECLRALCRCAGPPARGSPRRRACRLTHHARGRREDEAAARWHQQRWQDARRRSSAHGPRRGGDGAQRAHAGGGGGIVEGACLPAYGPGGGAPRAWRPSTHACVCACLYMQVVEEEGVAALFKGAAERVMRSSPQFGAACVCMQRVHA